MLRLLIPLLAPGAKLPPDATQFSLGYEGLSWGTAFFIFVVLSLVVAWCYRRGTPGPSSFRRCVFIALRCLLIALLLLVLVRPILLVTLEQTVRRPFLVLLDQTQSMTFADQRSKPDDLVRAGIATGALDPAGGLNQAPPTDAKLKAVARRDLLEALAANTKLNLWPRLNQRSSLEFFGFGRKLAPIGDLAAPENSPLTPDESAAFFHPLAFDQDLTAIGDGLRDLLDQERGQPLAGILLITDGANNSGSSPVEAAVIAKEDGVPLYIYGIGVTSPQDILVASLDAPQVSNMKEKLDVTAHVRALGMIGRHATIQLKADGKVVDEEPLEFRTDGEQEVTLSYTPDAMGVANLEAVVPPLPDEAVKDNNSATAHVRIIDEKLHVLYVENQTTWDYVYLLGMLQRDRRYSVKCILLKGDRGMDVAPDSPYLDALPADKATLYANDLIIIGDVDPTDLGDDWMKLVSDWVDKLGGGLLFKAGRKFDPGAYRNTPLEPLLPVELREQPADEYPNPVRLKLTTVGEGSPILSLAADPHASEALWEGFPGVRWTAWVGKARPGAQVLLGDPTPARATEQNLMPVMAQQDYGAGQTFYIGTDETYLWRSKVGEKYYTQIWGQIIQALTAQHTAGASAQTQLKTDRPGYFTGDKVTISARVFQAGFTPVTDAELPGSVTITPAAAPGRPPAPAITHEVRLQAIADRPGEYRAQMPADVAGSYSYSLARDPSVVVKWQVEQPHIEMADIAMNDKLLRAMAGASGGRFLREEDLNSLPGLVAGQSSNSVSFQKIPLAFAPILLVLMILTACVEWLWRRKVELK